MQIADLSRSTGFRFSLIFLVFLGITSVTVFSLLYLDTKRFLNHHMDEWISREYASLRAMPVEDLPKHLDRHALFDVGSDWPIMLYDAGHHEIGGTPMAIPQLPAEQNTPFIFVARWHNGMHRFRGLYTQLPNGWILVISERLWWASALDHEWFERSLLGLGIAAAFGLGGLAFLGASSQRRIGVFTAVAQRVTAGDLSGRMPVRNRSDDLDKLAGLVNEMLDHIERLVRQISSFRDAVSHDLLAPLSRLRITLDAARNNGESITDYATAVEVAIRESKTIERLLAAMRRLSEMETDARRAGFTQVDLREVAAEVFDFYQPIAEDRGIELTIALPDQITMTRGDRDLLFEAIGNLLDNALKFTPRDGAVVVTVLDGPALGVELKDTGPGIPEAERDLVLQRFYRRDASSTIRGTGLGLALVSAIADLHGMDLAISSGSPGCTIRLTTRRLQLAA
jgi:signal transduction histidine kinase